MRNISDGRTNSLALDFEENLEEFIQLLNLLSIVPYLPVIIGMTVVMAGVMVRGGHPKATARTFAALLVLNWASLRWLQHRFLSSPNGRKHHIVARS
jgi:hypothetical protein